MATQGPDDDLVYNYGGIHNIAGRIEQFVGQMNANLDEVDGVFKNLLANGWGGSEGAAAFEAQSKKWHTGANEMAATLRTLATKTSDGAVTMKQIDAKAAQRFSVG